MEIGFYINDETLQKWYDRSLPMAKEILSSFKNLNELFNNFSDYENQKYNIFCNYVLGHTLQDFTGKIKPYSRQMLENLDYLIDMFNINKINEEQYQNLKSQLKDNDYQKSSFAFDELYLANELAVKFGMTKIELYPSLSGAGTYSDVLVKLDHKSVYFELTNMGLSEPQKIIYSIMNEVAKYIGHKINRDDCYIEIVIGPEGLVRNKDGGIDKHATEEYLCKEADKLEIHKLAGFKGSFEFSVGWMWALIDTLLKGKPIPQNMLKERNEFVRSLPMEWLREREDPGIHNPFKSFTGGYSDGLKVIIKTGGTNPFHLEEFEADSFIKRIKGKIKFKIEKDQLEHGAPNIIVIRGTTSAWGFFNGGEWLTDFIEIRKEISEFLKENDFPHLSGVIWFNQNINDAKLILNPNVYQDSKLNEKDLKVLGFAIHSDKEYSFFGSSFRFNKIGIHQ